MLGAETIARHESAAHDDATIIVLIETVAAVQRVVIACERAHVLGIRAGMTLAHARALLPLPAGTSRAAVHDGRPASSAPRFLIEAYDGAREERALAALAQWAMRFSPIVAIDPPDGLLLDVRGCQRLFRGEKTLLRTVVDAVTRLGVTPRVAIAGTYGCAWAAARYGGGSSIIPSGGERDALARMPIIALRLPDDAVVGLHAVNVTAITHLLALPRRDLAARFGMVVLRRLDQAIGMAPETIDPIRPRQRLAVIRRFDGPVRALEGVLETVRAGIDALTARLLEAHEGVRVLDLRLDRSDAPPERATITCSRASADAAHLWALLRPKVERMNLGHGVEVVHLSARRTARLRDHQAAMWHDDRPGAAPANGHTTAAALGAFVDAVADRFGPRGIVRIDPVESHRPERAVRMRAAIESLEIRRDDAALALSPRPSCLMDRPHPIAVMALTPDGPPLRVQWGDAFWTVLASTGPERLAHEWWAPACERGGRDADTDGPRDYYRVQDETGRWWWIFRAHRTGRWFVHGVWG